METVHNNKREVQPQLETIKLISNKDGRTIVAKSGKLRMRNLLYQLFQSQPTLEKHVFFPVLKSKIAE